MLTKKQEKAISDAFNLLESYGIYMCVPGWFDLSEDIEAVQFADDPEMFYELRNPDYHRS